MVNPFLTPIEIQVNFESQSSSISKKGYNIIFDPFYIPSICSIKKDPVFGVYNNNKEKRCLHSNLFVLSLLAAA